MAITSLMPPNVGVGELDVDAGLAEGAGQLAQGPGPVLDVDDQDLAVVGHTHARLLERALGRLGLLVEDQDVDDPAALAGERAHPLEVDSRPAGGFTQPRQLAGAILQDDGQVPCHLASRGTQPYCRAGGASLS